LKTYSNKLESPKEMHKLVDTYGLPKLNQEDINNLNRSIKSNKIEAITNTLPMKKRSGLDGFTTRLLKKN
jgi:hypothetical protein